MRRLYALQGILSPFPQRPLCVVGRGWGEGKIKCRGGEGGRWGMQSLLPSSTTCLLFSYFLIIIFHQLSILSRVVNSISCYVSQLLYLLDIYRPEVARWNFILAKNNSVQGLF